LLNGLFRDSVVRVWWPLDVEVFDHSNGGNLNRSQAKIGAPSYDKLHYGGFHKDMIINSLL
jgi:hypothetical protein